MKLAKPSSKIFLLTVQDSTSFVDHLCYLCLVFVMLSRLFIAALWLPAWKTILSYEVAFRSVITQCIKIAKPLVVYRFG